MYVYPAPSKLWFQKFVALSFWDQWDLQLKHHHHGRRHHYPLHIHAHQLAVTWDPFSGSWFDRFDSDDRLAKSLKHDDRLPSLIKLDKKDDDEHDQNYDRKVIWKVEPCLTEHTVYVCQCHLPIRLKVLPTQCIAQYWCVSMSSNRKSNPPSTNTSTYLCPKSI